MREMILCKLGEVVLKGLNRRSFEDKLIGNLRRREKAESSAAVRERVNAARDIQKKRFAGTPITCNAYMTAPMVGEFCRLDAAGEKLLKGAFDRLGLTARSHDKLLRVARTIADLDGSEKIESYHLAEAIQYRNTDILRGEG